MFFLATYGVTNLAFGLERWASSPNFRPSFRVPAWVGIVGAGACGMAWFAAYRASPDARSVNVAADLLPSAGLGLRIRLTKENPIDYRIDVAIGADEEVILYLSAGQAF